MQGCNGTRILSDQKYNLTFHLGLHKTGTTALQRDWFPAWHDVNVLSTETAAAREYDDMVCTRDSVYFDAHEGRRMLEAILDPSRPNLMSREAFSGSPYAGVGKLSLDHRSDILRNLSSSFPEARAILVLRRQDTYAISLYREYLKSGGCLDIRGFCLGSDGVRPVLSLDRFFYLRYVDFLWRAFPAGVLVLAYERFVAEQQEFLKDFGKFVGVAMPQVSNSVWNATTLGPKGLRLARFASRFVKSQLNPGGFIPPLRIPYVRGGRSTSLLWLLHDRGLPWGRRSRNKDVFPDIKHEILERVRKDNRILDLKYGLGLERFGYY